MCYQNHTFVVKNCQIWKRNDNHLDPDGPNIQVEERPSIQLKLSKTQTFESL